jgi:hypothetical protein
MEMKAMDGRFWKRTHSHLGTHFALLLLSSWYMDTKVEAEGPCGPTPMLRLAVWKEFHRALGCLPVDLVYAGETCALTDDTVELSFLFLAWCPSGIQTSS